MPRFDGLQLVWLETFVEVAGYRNRMAAATALGINDSTVTKHIQKLEQWLGGQMLLKVNAGLYPAGEKLFPVAVQILELLEEARQLPVYVEAPPAPRVSGKDIKIPGRDRTPKDG